MRGSRKTCFQKYKKGDITKFLEQFWNMEKRDQDGFVSWLEMVIEFVCAMTRVAFHVEPSYRWLS